MMINKKGHTLCAYLRERILTINGTRLHEGHSMVTSIAGTSQGLPLSTSRRQHPGTREQPEEILQYLKSTDPFRVWFTSYVL